MIVKNEEQVLARCLDSVASCVDEIVIVDTGSTDRTVTIASEYTKRIYSYEWLDDFSAARNFAFEQASCDYVMWLDADDVVPSETVQQISLLKAIDFEHRRQFAMKYCVGEDRKDGTIWFYRERIFLRRSAIWQGYVHESVPWKKGIRLLPCCIEHKKYGTSGSRNLGIFLRQRVREKTDYRMQYYFCRELYDHGYDILCERNLTYLLRQRLLTSGDSVQACILLSALAKKSGNFDRSLQYLLSVEEYGPYTPSVCYRIATHFAERRQYDRAICWYQRALETDFGVYDFVEEDVETFLPHLMLCVCYDRIGNKVEALRHHKICAELKPDDPYVKKNEVYFASLSRRVPVMHTME